MALWEIVNSPLDLKKLSIKELNEYAGELRQHIISTVVACGGHLASNLGVVELTVALHYSFDCPKDKIVWDVGHQCYAHKIITGRRKYFDDNLLRKNDGISGFPIPSESEYDSFISGHASTSLSVLSGFIKSRKIKGESNKTIAVIGDGSFTGGMVYEALNEIGASGEPAIIILNDNDMSISHNVGAVNKYFNSLRLSKNYLRLKSDIKKGVSAIPVFGAELLSGLQKLKDGAKSLLIKEKMFEQLGFKYYGPYDGHNIEDLIEIFSAIKDKSQPVILHLITKKGYGYNEAEHNPEKFHGIAPPSSAVTYEFSKAVGSTLIEMAQKDDRVVAFTAAMASGTGLNIFGEKFPERYFDMGIAEQNAVTVCAAMAKEGLKPYFAVYSTFLQRAFDQVIHDVCIQNLPVTFLLDRSGVVGSDGVTHQGVFDLSYLSLIPNMTIVAPKDDEELRKIMLWSLNYNAPLSIRYPKNCKTRFESAEIYYGKWQILRKEESHVYILASGSRAVDVAMQTNGTTIVNALFIKPLDVDLLSELDKTENVVITVEDNALHGGFGWAVNNCLTKAKLIKFAHSDNFVTSLDISQSLAQSGISFENLQRTIDEISLEKK